MRAGAGADRAFGSWVGETVASVIGVSFGRGVSQLYHLVVARATNAPSGHPSAPAASRSSRRRSARPRTGRGGARGGRPGRPVARPTGTARGRPSRPSARGVSSPPWTTRVGSGKPLRSASRAFTRSIARKRRCPSRPVVVATPRGSGSATTGGCGVARDLPAVPRVGELQRRPCPVEHARGGSQEGVPSAERRCREHRDVRQRAARQQVVGHDEPAERVPVDRGREARRAARRRGDPRWSSR